MILMFEHPDQTPARPLRRRRPVLRAAWAALLVVGAYACATHPAHAQEAERVVCPRTVGECTFRVQQSASPGASHVCQAPEGEPPVFGAAFCIPAGPGEVVTATIPIEPGQGTRILAVWAYNEAEGFFSSEPAMRVGVIRELAPPELLDVLLASFRRLVSELEELQR